MKWQVLSVGDALQVVPALRLNFQNGTVAFDRTLVDLHGTVRVEGKLRNSQVGLGRVFPLPTPVIGTAKDVACAELTQQLLAAP